MHYFVHNQYSQFVTNAYNTEKSACTETRYIWIEKEIEGDRNQSGLAKRWKEIEVNIDKG